jgi:TonB family protein
VPPVGSVRPGNQRALNTARMPFASYLNGMHQRIHPIFAERFLESVASRPASDPLSNPSLTTTLELALGGAEGRIDKWTLVRSSGLSTFDAAVVGAVMKAAPFGAAPPEILSSDGRVYVHWEFHRDPMISCSTINVRPFLLAL